MRCWLNSLITLTTGKETIVKSLLISHFDDFVNGVNRYGINYAEYAIDYGEQFVNAISAYPQYADDIINIIQKRQNVFLQTLNSLPEDKAITYIYHTKLDIYRTEVSNKFDKVAIAFVRDKQICGMSACGIRTKNDTILSKTEIKYYKNTYDNKMNYINTKEGYSNLYKSLLSVEHLKDLPDEYFVEVGVSRDSIAVELQKLNNAIEQTKKSAETQGLFNGLGNPSFVERYDVENCAEVWSIRQAIMEGAKFSEIEYKCVYKKSGAYAFPCDNCERTFSELKDSGKEDEWYAE